MSPTDLPVLLDVQDGVATIILNRPQVLNALDDTMIAALGAILPQVAANPAARAVILRGSGPAFMAGGDIGNFKRLLAEHPDRRGLEPLIVEMAARAQHLIKTIRSMPKPVIASVHGACAGFGLSLMLACDLALAADDTKFTLAYIHLGTSPDGGASFHLERAVGQKRAAEIALLGDRFGAVEAERWGLVNRIVPAAELEAQTAKMAGRLATGPAQAYGRTKALFNAARTNDLDAQLDAEAHAFAASVVTEDFAEGIAAFLEKRPASFHGK